MGKAHISSFKGYNNLYLAWQSILGWDFSGRKQERISHVGGMCSSLGGGVVKRKKGANSVKALGQGQGAASRSVSTLGQSRKAALLPIPSD